MKKQNRIGWLMVAALVIATLVQLATAETKYATGTSSAAVTFSAQDGGWTVNGLYATSDKETGAVKFYHRTGNKVAPSASATNGATVISVSNSSYTLTTNDVVVYQHVNGTVDYRTVSAASTTTITLDSGISVAGATGDYIFELTQGGQIVVGYDGAAVGAADGVATSGNVYQTPGDSPLRVVVDATSNAVLQVTANPGR